jgi:hypothetical protein
VSGFLLDTDVALLAVAATALPLQPRHVAELLALPPLHSDPFDRALTAQATAEELALLTADGEIPLRLRPLARRGLKNEERGILFYMTNSHGHNRSIAASYISSHLRPVFCSKSRLNQNAELGISFRCSPTPNAC